MFRVFNKRTCKMRCFGDLDDAKNYVKEKAKKDLRDRFRINVISENLLESELWDYTIDEFDEKPLIEELKNIDGISGFECTLNNSYKDIETNEWGMAIIWIDTLGIGVEYNFCIENGENYSGIYLTKYNKADDYIYTDHSTDIHYEVDFDDSEWEKKLENAMWKALLELGNL